MVTLVTAKGQCSWPYLTAINHQTSAFSFKNGFPHAKFAYISPMLIFIHSTDEWTYMMEAQVHSSWCLKGLWRPSASELSLLSLRREDQGDEGVPESSGLHFRTGNQDSPWHFPSHFAASDLPWPCLYHGFTIVAH